MSALPKSTPELDLSPSLGARVRSSNPPGDPNASPARPDAPVFERFTPPAGTEIDRLECWHFHSAILPDDRTLSVYLPPQYTAEPERRFPVFYLHDGQNLFDPHTSYVPGHTWRAGEAADRTNAEGRAEPVILVGIANTGMRRMAEYTPTRDLRLGGGEGDLYGRLLVEELKPWADRTFRTRPLAADTGLGGSSLGGLISLYLGLAYPQVFNRLAVLSPSIWWDRRIILNFLDNGLPHPPLRIWLDIGSAEGMRHVRDTELLASRLVKLGWKPDIDFKFTLVNGGMHTEDAWAIRFADVLAFLYPAR